MLPQESRLKEETFAKQIQDQRWGKSIDKIAFKVYKTTA